MAPRDDHEELSQLLASSSTGNGPSDKPSEEASSPLLTPNPTPPPPPPTKPSKTRVDFSSLPRGFTYKLNGQSNDLLTTAYGSMPATLLFLTWIGGATSPFWLSSLLARGAYSLSALSILGLSWAFLCDVPKSPTLINFLLRMHGYFRGGCSLTCDENMNRGDWDVNSPNMLCLHPHGIFCNGFILNIAARLHGGHPDTLLPPPLAKVSPEACGVVEPLLFSIPLIRTFLLAFGAAKPASKETMQDIFAKQTPFALLPGGSEEIVLCESGKENVYIKNRAGFIKYAMQHGYQVIIGYTFGESDLYHTLGWWQEWRLRFFQKYRIPLFLGSGQWWCPILPRRDVPLHTVMSLGFKLPKIENPTEEDVARYHALYIEKLVELFEKHKHMYGYGDRTLNIY